MGFEEQIDTGDRAITSEAREYLTPGGESIKASLRIDRKEPNDPYAMYLIKENKDGSEENIHIAFLGNNTDVAVAVYEKVRAISMRDKKPPMPTEGQVQTIRDEIMAKKS
ncbi:MAG: hypothetical protein WCK48_00150 [bacterium]